MKYQSPEPEQQTWSEYRIPTLCHLCLGISQQRAEAEHLHGHSPYYAHCTIRIVQLIMSNPGQCFLLSASGRDTKRNGDAGPAQHPIDQPGQKNAKSKIGDDDAQQWSKSHTGADHSR